MFKSKFDEHIKELASELEQKSSAIGSFEFGEPITIDFELSELGNSSSVKGKLNSIISSKFQSIYIIILKKIPQKFFWIFLNLKIGSNWHFLEIIE